MLRADWLIFDSGSANGSVPYPDDLGPSSTAEPFIVRSQPPIDIKQPPNIQVRARLSLPIATVLGVDEVVYEASLLSLARDIA